MDIDVLNLTFTILSIAIPVFATIYTAYSRIRNENRETHKPYLVLDEIVKLDDINKYKYYLNFTPTKDVNTKNKLFISLPSPFKSSNPNVFNAVSKLFGLGCEDLLVATFFALLNQPLL